ncbi:hypothetical protein CMQ_7537 [Grosmannia clavigera kw1407]|uniref:Uncharacterized protein n=1 Tax=Grosmannia clavigera (strain kw1407 / UAMH 11150) TaxID=655863 RepID=F0XQH4_GROCL|nr:uncharacterized protein CMQ_7537 [Grosmannia clavigera kw1407]EFX00535.1 hypothetical protein CMQ_7537 [Grosmannia clavigera kw1407]
MQPGDTCISYDMGLGLQYVLILRTSYFSDEVELDGLLAPTLTEWENEEPFCASYCAPSLPAPDPSAAVRTGKGAVASYYGTFHSYRVVSRTASPIDATEYEQDTESVCRVSVSGSETHARRSRRSSTMKA